MSLTREGRAMLASTLVMAAMACALMALVLWRGGDPTEGVTRGMKLLMKVAPLILFAFIAVGTLPLVLPTEAVAQWLGPQSGWRGLMAGTLAGAVSPGGPLVQSSLAAGFWQAGAGLGTVIAYLVAGVTWGIALMLEEVALLGWRIVFIRLACTFFMAPLAGWLAQTLFGGVAR